MPDPDPPSAPEETEISVKGVAAQEYAASPMELEVNQLMTATKAGDPDAFDRLVDLLRGRAFHIAHSLVGSREDAVDMAQEAFLKTYRARETFRDGEPFLPWFHKILRNTCFSFLRKHKRLRKVSLSGDREEDEGDWEIESDLPRPGRGAEHDEMHSVFWSAMTRLTSKDREILALRHFQELSYKEIAHALEIPEGTVMSRLYHARRHLRDQLQPHLDGVLSGYDLEGGRDESSGKGNAARGVKR